MHLAFVIQHKEGDVVISTHLLLTGSIRVLSNGSTGKIEKCSLKGSMSNELSVLKKMHILHYLFMKLLNFGQEVFWVKPTCIKNLPILTLTKSGHTAWFTTYTDYMMFFR